MTIEKLVAGQKGSVLNSTGSQVRDTVNALVDAVNRLTFNPLAFQLSTIQPTVTVSAVNAASSIPSSVRIQPMRLASDTTKFDVVNDPNFRIFGVPVSKATVDAGDMFRPTILTGGTPQAARWRPYVEFTHTGQQFEIFLRAVSTSFSYRFWVNGRPLTLSTVTQAATATGRYRILVDFGSVGVRDVRFEMQEFSWGGVFVEPFGSVTRPSYKRKSLAIMSDSTGAGANGVGPYDAWPLFASAYLGMDCANLAIGGTGYIAATSFQSRLQDVIDVNPDYLFIAGGQNDKAGNTTAAIMDAFRLFCDSVAAALPACKIIVGGVHMTSQNADITGAALEAALRAECALRGYPFISQRDPKDNLSTLPLWANGVNYVIGDLISQNELPFVCTVNHTSSGSFNAANFRCSALFSGTGRVGATANNGNFDICMSNDGIHFTAQGMLTQAANYAEQIALKV